MSRYGPYRSEQEKAAFSLLGKGLYHAGRGAWGATKMVGRGARAALSPLAYPLRGMSHLGKKGLKASVRTPKRAMFTGSAGLSAYFVADAFKQNPRLTRTQMGEYTKLKKNNQETSNMRQTVSSPAPSIPQTHYGQYNMGSGIRKSASFIEDEIKKEALRRMGRVGRRRVLLRPGRPPKARRLANRRTR